MNHSFLGRIEALLKKLLSGNFVSRPDEHDSVFELLPWYVNETLEGRELSAVLKHLADCRTCQQERDRLYATQQFIVEDDPSAHDTSLSFHRMLRRIEASEKNRESLRDFDLIAGARQGRWLATGLAAALVLGIGLLVQTPSTPSVGGDGGAARRSGPEPVRGDPGDRRFQRRRDQPRLPVGDRCRDAERVS